MATCVPLLFVDLNILQRCSIKNGRIGEKNTSATDYCEKRNHLSNFVRDTLTLVVAAVMTDLALGSL